MKQICAAENCTGCLACMNCCPKDAITADCDANGTIRPRIDGDKCIDCGLCARVCPANREPVLFQAAQVYAAWSSQDPESASGGLAAVLSREMIARGGAVYGAAVEGRTVRHIRVTDGAELSRLRGSKYVQSDMGLAYRQAWKDLQSGIPVLFIGTPCQVAGLRAFLRKEEPLLVTADLICHGTPPQKYLREHLDRQTGGSWDGFSFRGKYDFRLTAYLRDKVVYQRPSETDSFFHAFLRALTYRDSCYRCPYARAQRVGDLTLGDFWGLDRRRLDQPYDGRVSLVMPNTAKGQALFDRVKDRIVWQPFALEDAVNGQQENLRRPSVAPEDRGRFRELYLREGFHRAVAKTGVGRELRRNRLRATLVYRGLRKVKRILLGR